MFRYGDDLKEEGSDVARFGTPASARVGRASRATL